MSHWSNALKRLGACRDAVAWASMQPSRKRAWERCERGDWMIWLSASLTTDRRPVVLAACACARLSLPYVQVGELRPLRAIEVTEAWCRGEATIDEVRAARAVTYGYAAAADAAYAAAAADAADASDAADAAADAYAYAAAYAAVAAAGAAYVAAYARARTLRECADICRRMLPMPELALRRKARAA